MDQHTGGAESLRWLPVQILQAGSIPRELPGGATRTMFSKTGLDICGSATKNLSIDSIRAPKPPPAGRSIIMVRTVSSGRSGT